MPDWQIIVIVCAVFALAGSVKGVLGFGLPTVSLGLLTAVLDLTTAITLLIMPSLATNIWQAIVGGHAAALWRRLWLFYSLAALTIWLGTLMLAYSRLSSVLLGTIFIVYALTSIAGIRYSIAQRHEKANCALFGVVNGVFTGMTGSFAFPGVLFLQGIGLPRDQLVQAMGILFTVSTLVLAAVLFARELLILQLNALSAVAIVPAVVGMAAGQRLRRHLPEARFRQVFYAGIMALGAYIIVKNIFIAGG